MELFLQPDRELKLLQCYRRAFEKAVELFIVSAFLTEWNSSFVLNPHCRRFKLIIGKDFGITRKKACEEVLRWLPPERKSTFLVADGISGFHPKAIFWKERDGATFAIIGSSNLTRAAFESNYEANFYASIHADEFKLVAAWIADIEKNAIAVSEDWIAQYNEAIPQSHGPKPPLSLKLPGPKGMKEQIETRREQMKAHEKKRKGLIRLFRQCAEGKITSQGFYEKLPQSWGQKIGNRLQGKGFEIKGKSSDFQQLATSFVRILDASDEQRDDVVTEEIDRLAEEQVTTRKAFFSEMLCLQYPDQFPPLSASERSK